MVIPGMAHRQNNNKDTTQKDSTKVTVYPNPTTGVVNVSISSLQNCNYATIYLSDSKGSLIATQKAESTISPVNLSSYKQGTYYLKVMLCNSQYSYTVIKTTPGTGAPTTTKAVVPR